MALDDVTALVGAAECTMLRAHESPSAFPHRQPIQA